jgi:NAD(P)-dependent dehydrogenase (short-subunit alcohol dehydrogenase family)
MADVALVFGASGPLGGAVVEALTARGDSVIAAGRSRVDLADPDAVEAFWEEIARDGELPRWVVNTAGGFRGGTLAASGSDDVHAMLATNLETALWTARAAARRLGEGSAIVNVSSRAAVSGGAGAAAYAVAKAGVVRLTEVLAQELAPQRIRVNAVLPSVIDTPKNRAARPADSLATAVAPTEIASVIAFLCSDAAAAVSGAAIPVYGWA